MNKSKVTFILHKPQLSENIGACARAIKNFDFQKLYLIDPKPIFPNDKILATSVGAKDIIKKSATPVNFWRKQSSLAAISQAIQTILALSASMKNSGEMQFIISKDPRSLNLKMQMLSRIVE